MPGKVGAFSDLLISDPQVSGAHRPFESNVQGRFLKGQSIVTVPWKLRISDDEGERVGGRGEEDTVDPSTVC